MGAQAAAIGRATAPHPQVAESSNVNYTCPVAECQVARAFAPGPNNWNAGHRGVDLVATWGANVSAAQDGTVVFAGKLNDRSLISIEHSEGVHTTYEPVTPLVKRGDVVRRGQLIGLLDPFHCAPASCLHWGGKIGADGYFNPLTLLGYRRVRLLE